MLEEVFVPTGHEVGMAAVSGNVAIGKDEGLLALTLSPAASKFVGAPVSLVEKVRNVNPTLGAVEITVIVLGVGHVVLEVGEASLGVVTRGEVDISSEGRVFAITSSIREPDTLTLVDRITYTSHLAIRLGIPRWERVIVVQAGASHSGRIDRTL
jgi:hypothetical protein